MFYLASPDSSFFRETMQKQRETKTYPGELRKDSRSEEKVFRCKSGVDGFCDTCSAVLAMSNVLEDFYMPSYRYFQTVM